MKKIENIDTDVKEGDLVRIYLDSGSSYNGVRWGRSLINNSLTLSGYSPDNSKRKLKRKDYDLLDVNKGELEGEKVLGYEVIRRASPRKRKSREELEETSFEERMRKYDDLDLWDRSLLRRDF